MANATHKNRLRQFQTNPLAEVDSLFQHFFGPQAASAAGWRAPASLWEDENRLYVELDAPGVSRESADVTYDKGTLSISLERSVPEGRAYHHNERGFGRLTRSLALPESVDPESIEAELKDGVLTVSIAKRPEAQPKKIELK